MDIDDDRAADVARQKRIATLAMEHLMGMVTGFVADGELQKSEIQFLSGWLAANSEVTQRWPGFVIARKIEEVMADGVITAAEQAHLLGVLRDLSSSDFSLTGSVTSEVAALPINDVVTVIITNSGVCHTGEFMFGTRAACERVTLRGGGMPLDSVSKRTDYLVVGTRISPAWAHTSYGRKIQKAAELQDQGHEIEIISERRWLEALKASV